VGAVEKIGARYYLMFGTGGKMVTLVADRPEGPFEAATTNLLLLSGNTYFSRFFPTPDGLLVNHHAIAADGRVFFAPLKRAVVDADGTLRLAWWEGNEKLKHRPVEVRIAETFHRTVAMLGSHFASRNGLVLEGTMAIPTLANEPRPGLYLDCGREAGLGILVGPGGVTELGPMRPDGSEFHAETRVDRQTPFGPKAAFRLLLKGSLLEFYLDDHLIQCWRLPAECNGRMGLLRSNSDAVSAVKAWH
jgi:hypothetical protein